MPLLHALTKLVMLACLFTSLLLGADLSGRWSGKADVALPDGNRTLALFFVLKHEDRKLTGTAGPNAESQHDISDGAVDGAEITFQVAGGKFVFHLHVDGDQLAGGVTVNEGGQSANGNVHLVRVTE